MNSFEITKKVSCLMERRGSAGVFPNISGVVMLRVILKENGENAVLNLHPETVRERIVIKCGIHDIEIPPFSFSVVDSRLGLIRGECRNELS